MRDASRLREAAEFGCAAYARAHGGAAGALVAVVPASSLGRAAGRGVVALREMPPGALITEYAGELRPPGASCSHAELDYAIEVPGRHSPDGRLGWRLVGRRAVGPKDGVAQIANDAIHPCATRRVNNCEFHWKDGACFLRATKRVEPGQELLVSYHIAYWICRRRAASAYLPPAARDWLRVVRTVSDQLEAHGFFLDDWVQQRQRQRPGSGTDCRVRVGPLADRPQCQPPACACPEGHWSGDAVAHPLWLDVRCVPGEDGDIARNIQWRCSACARHTCPLYFYMRADTADTHRRTFNADSVM